jgi:alpha-D-ribose 1-methylphosphonate 5-triphosphate synthase subunit PhnH
MEKVTAPFDGADSQATFRSFLDAMSRPGSVRPLSLPDPAVPPPLLLALALADVGTTLAVIGPDADEWGFAAVRATGATLVGSHLADHVVFLRPPAPHELRALRRGTADRPELGALVALPAGGFESGHPIRLSGPGVPDVAVLRSEGLPVEVFETLASINADFPCGIDTLLLAPTWLAAIPRSSTIDIIFEEGPWATQR